LIIGEGWTPKKVWKGKDSQKEALKDYGKPEQKQGCGKRARIEKGPEYYEAKSKMNVTTELEIEHWEAKKAKKARKAGRKDTRAVV
jgi:hypothetical protein